jgi:hypothetical protein
MTITVTAKINAGTHPRLGAIIQGQAYTIEEADFSPVLFDRDPVIPAVIPAKSGKKGR